MVNLESEITYLPGVGPKRAKVLGDELGIKTFADLLMTFPYKYIDRSKVYRIDEVNTEMPYVQILGRILSFETFEMGPRKERVVAHFTDGTHLMDLTWFNGGKYARTHYKIGEQYIVFGKPTAFNGRINVVHPDIDPASELQVSGMGMQPYYTLTEKMKKAGFTSRSLERLIKNLLALLDNKLPETLPDSMTQRLNLASRDEALRNIHFPESAKTLEKARVRLKFEELFYVQLNIVRYASDNRRKYRGYLFQSIGKTFNGFYYHRLPFPLTGAQKRVIREIWHDMKSGRQMNRLLQGDVGSGKTPLWR